MNNRRISKATHWALLVATVLVVISGLGITEYQTITALTLGLLGKAAAFKLHLVVWIPFVVLLLAHVLLTARPFRRRRSTKSTPAGSL